MQAEGGRTIERRRGMRAATTFKKLPSASPGAKNMAARTASTKSLSAARAVALARKAGRSVGRSVGDDRARHSDWHVDERPGAGVNGLVEDHRAAEHRPLRLRERVHLDRVRREQTALAARADDLDRVPGRHPLAVAALAVRA